MDKQEAIVQGMFMGVSEELDKPEYTGVHILLFAALFVRKYFRHEDADTRVQIMRMLADVMDLELDVVLVPLDKKSIN